MFTWFRPIRQSHTGRLVDTLTEPLRITMTGNGWSRRALRQFSYRTDDGQNRYRWIITCTKCGRHQYAAHFLGGVPCDCHARKVA